MFDEDTIPHIAEVHAREIHARLSDAERASCLRGEAVFDDYMDEGQSLAQAFEFVTGRAMWTPADIDDGLCTKADIDADWAIVSAAIDAANYLID